MDCDVREACVGGEPRSYDQWFHLSVRRHVVEDQQAVGVPQVVFEVFNRLALRHHLRVFSQCAEPERLALPVHHGQPDHRGLLSC
jgi:hypothetical protein